MLPTKINALNYRFCLFLLGIYVLHGQIPGTANGSLAETGIYLKNLHVDLTPDHEPEGTRYTFDLGEISFGFSDLSISQKQKGDTQFFSTKISGPNFNLNQLKLSARLSMPDWVTGERIKRLEKRESIPKEAIGLIEDAVDLFKLDLEKNPKSLNDLYIQKYLDLDADPFSDQTWSYSLALPDQIIAQPSQIHPVAETQPVYFDWQSRTFQTNPLQDSLYQIPDTFWDYVLEIREISQHYSSRIEIVNYPEKTKFDFILDRGQFKIENISFTATPANNLNNHSKIHLPNLLLEATKVAFEGDVSTQPILHHGTGKFSIRNFEIKIPEDLKEEPEIQKLLETLGIWNNAFKVRLVELAINLINEYTGDIHFVFATPFLKINVNGDFSLRQDEIHPEMLLHQMEVRIQPIALGVRKWIREWEKKEGKTLHRKGATIVLKLEGPLEKPVIHGFD